MHISHNRNLILGCPIKGEGLNSVGYGQILYQKTFRRALMMRSVEASLTRLQTDRIDLYWVHMADGVILIEEIVRGFDDLVRSGKILYAGLSNFPASGKYRAREEGRLQRLGMLVHTEKT